MATLDSLKRALRQTATAATSSPRQPLSDTQYSAGFDILVRGSGRLTYEGFILPQASRLLAPLFDTRSRIAVLEVGPGPESVLGRLPVHQRRKVNRYVAFEPNGLYAARLQEWLRPTSEKESPLPCLTSPPDIHQNRFVPDTTDTGSGAAGTDSRDGDEKFDVVLFCHSMYGMKPKRRFVERALEMLVEKPEGGMVVVFHRDDGTLHLDGLVCHRTASSPNGVVCVADDDGALDHFAPFIAGFVVQEEEGDADADGAVRAGWREVCRALGGREEAHPGRLVFSAPNVMAAFTRHATALPELTAQVPLVEEGGGRAVKSWEARRHRPAATVRPTEVRHVQQCVRWALEHRLGLAVIGGGHSGQCLRPNAVSVDMGAFDQAHVFTSGGKHGGCHALPSDCGVNPLVVAGAGCKTGDIIRKAMAAGLTVPLGARPGVGAGLWLQGGIGHLSRLHGLACDSIVGAVVIGVDSGQVLCVGRVPSQHQLAGAVRPEHEDDLLWAIKGAGSNFGIVVSVTFKAHEVPTYSIRNWVLPLSGNLEARRRLRDFDELVARGLHRNRSADAYLYWENGQLHLGVTVFEASTRVLTSESSMPMPMLTSVPTPASTVLGPESNFQIVDCVGLFETEMYVSGMHGGHGGGKTSSFKRCLFLKGIGAVEIVDALVEAVEARPSPLCYLHLLQGGGEVGKVAADATAFGCRDWDFACVVTGVWPRDQDGTETAQAAVRWVYNVALGLLPLSCGAYGADLGSDPRDGALAAKAFGLNRRRLAHLKRSLDPSNVLSYACPLAKVPMEHKLIVLVTGDMGAGKDYCAHIWAQLFIKRTHGNVRARVVSISDETKRQYAAATGADLGRLLWDRSYKERHRPALMDFFHGQWRQRPRLLEEHFLSVVKDAVADVVDVLLITGMRDKAPVAGLYHLVPPGCRLLEVRVKASKEMRRVRRGLHVDDDVGVDHRCANLRKLDPRPSLVFHNDTSGKEEAEMFAQRHLLPFFHQDLERLADMVPPVPDFPRQGIEFRHVLGIAQRPGGLALVTSLLQTHFTGDWTRVDAVACCEAGGFLYASVLAARVGLPLALIREVGKLPPPTVSVSKSSSYISSSAPNGSREKTMEMDRDVIPRDASVVVVDDVLATGETLLAVLCLLTKDNMDVDVKVMVVAEFPAHRGREMLRQRGFGRVTIQSLLVFGGS